MLDTLPRLSILIGKFAREAGATVVFIAMCFLPIDVRAAALLTPDCSSPIGLCVGSEAGYDPEVSFIRYDVTNTIENQNPPGTASLSLGVSLPASGTIGPGTIPVSWNITVTPITNSWGVLLIFAVEGQGTFSTSFLTTFGTQTFSGSSTFDVPGGEVTGYEISLQVDPVSFGGLPPLVEVNSAFLNLNPPVPEPASPHLLLATGVLVLLGRMTRINGRPSRP